MTDPLPTFDPNPPMIGCWLGQITSGDEAANRLLREANVIIYNDRDTDKSELVFGKSIMQHQAAGDELIQAQICAVTLNLAGGELPVLLREVIAAKGWHDYEAPQGQN